ncbi:MAG: hypothetical protein QNJ55_22430 [Xenococcus sp. MO_188.B8]|nr:hypothetical protein [Xenococcus sp. MO_188.B8]
MNEVLGFSQYIDWLFKFFGILLASTAIFQLHEARMRRLVEMYWKIADEYLSEDSHARRLAIAKIEDWLNKEKNRFGVINVDLDLNSQIGSQLVTSYVQTFHDAEPESSQKKLDIQARHHIRFLNQIGILVKKNLIDKDLLFSLIGSGLEIDHKTLQVILKGHRTAHNANSMYNQFDYLCSRYEGWRLRTKGSRL